MKILQICPGVYQSGYGGLSEHVKNISERLARKHSVTVFATNPHGALPWRETVNGVTINRFHRIAPDGAYQFSPDMLINLKKVKFEIVHAHGYHALPLHYSWVAKHDKLVLSTHFHGFGHTPFRNSVFRLFKPFGSYVLSEADALIAVSEYEKSMLGRYFKLSPSKIHFIPNGLDLSEFDNIDYNSFNGKKSSKSLLYIGRLESYKGVSYLIRVLPKLGDEIELIIVGKGSLRNHLEIVARQLNVINRVRFLSDLPRRQLLDLYSKADLLLLLSEHEAYSLVVADALASGTPCLVGNTSALSEWVDNISCFGINLPTSLGELAVSINRALRTQRKSVIKVFKEKWLGTKILDWNEVVRDLERVYIDS